jgi:hypoxanthine-guanine phosphoribosyltransferase
MTTVQVHGLIFEPYISEEKIQESVKEVAAKISHDYQGKGMIYFQS